MNLRARAVLAVVLLALLAPVSAQKQTGNSVTGSRTLTLKVGAADQDLKVSADGYPAL